MPKTPKPAARVTIRRFDANSYQVFFDAFFIGVASKYTSGIWKLHDANDRAIPAVGAHDSPKALAASLNKAVAGGTTPWNGGRTVKL